MTQDEIIRMAREAGSIDSEDVIETVYAAFAEAERKKMTEEGWRQCAVGQRTTQFCGATEAAIKEEREACAKVCEEVERKATKQPPMVGQGCQSCAAAIRARGNK